MNVSRVVPAVIFALYLWTLPVYPGEPPRPLSDMIGEALINSDSARLISFRSDLILKINPDLIVKGDRLDIYDIKNDFLMRKGGPAAERIGQLVVMSGSGETPVGKVQNLSREITRKVFLAFSLPDHIHLNRYAPFLQSMADTYLDSPDTRPLNIAVIDVINPYGDRTSVSEVILEDVRRKICARPQFKCVDAKSVTEVLRINNAATSRGVDSHVEQELLSRLMVDVFVTGHLKRNKNEVDLLLRARSIHPDVQPRQVWRRFGFTEKELGIDPDRPEKVTVPYRRTPQGRLRIKMLDIESVEGMKAEYFFYEDLSDLFYYGASEAGQVVANDFFVKVDGKKREPGAGGMFYDGRIAAESHSVTIGYYPAMIEDGETRKISEIPIQKTFEIVIGEGDNFNLDLVGKIEKGYSLLIADSYLTEEPI